MPDPIADPYAESDRDGSRDRGPAATSGAAIGSVVSALLCPAAGGLLSVALGVVARGDIQQSRGTKTGLWIAHVGIALGTLNLVASVAGFAGLVAWASTRSPSPPPAPPSPIVTTTPAPTSVVPTPPSTTTPSPSPGRGAMSVDDRVTTTNVGNITLVDLGREVSSLESALETQRTQAAARRERVIVWLVWPDCEPCNGVAASLPDARMQKALASIRLVRVDVTEFSRDLKRLDIPTTPVPGFAMLGPANRPVDYVHGGEWDEDVPVNIAPVLESFVRGRYGKRRHPWRGGHRDDETPL